MTIGEALLNLRKQLGLTQTEMAANVVSTSFYSKVERNIHDIGTNDLLQILNKHQINATYNLKSGAVMELLKARLC